jgi:hypothetical protein
MKILILFLSLFAFAFGVFAQSPDKILKQAEKALGGAKNLRAVKSQRKTGTIRASQGRRERAFRRANFAAEFL